MYLKHRFISKNHKLFKLIYNMDILVKLVGITLAQNGIKVLDMEICGKKLNVCLSAETTALQLRRLMQIFPGVIIDIDPADPADCPEFWITITKGGKQ